MISSGMSRSRDSAAERDRAILPCEEELLDPAEGQLAAIRAGSDVANADERQVIWSAVAGGDDGIAEQLQSGKFEGRDRHLGSVIKQLVSFIVAGRASACDGRIFTSWMTCVIRASFSGTAPATREREREAADRSDQAESGNAR